MGERKLVVETWTYLDDPASQWGISHITNDEGNNGPCGNYHKHLRHDTGQLASADIRDLGAGIKAPYAKQVVNTTSCLEKLACSTKLYGGDGFVPTISSRDQHERHLEQLRSRWAPPRIRGRGDGGGVEKRPPHEHA